MAGKLRVFLKDDSAAPAIEYRLIATDIAVAIISVVRGPSLVDLMRHEIRLRPCPPDGADRRA